MTHPAEDLGSDLPASEPRQTGDTGSAFAWGSEVYGRTSLGSNAI